jgi:hypothetical protein
MDTRVRSAEFEREIARFGGPGKRLTCLIADGAGSDRLHAGWTCRSIQRVISYSPLFGCCGSAGVVTRIPSLPIDLLFAGVFQWE